MERICLKCSHVNQHPTGAELEECPRCGAIYSRVEAQRQASLQTPRPGPWKLSPWAFPVLAATLLLLAYNHATAPPKPDHAPAATPVQCGPDDAQCIGERDSLAASSACTPMIESKLSYRHEWTDGFLGEKFDRAMFYQPGRTIIYHGNELRAENGFGAWQKVRYFCVWDFHSRSAIKAGINN